MKVDYPIWYTQMINVTILSSAYKRILVFILHLINWAAFINCNFCYTYLTVETAEVELMTS